MSLMQLIHSIRITNKKSKRTHVDKESEKYFQTLMVHQSNERNLRLKLNH